MYGHREIKTFAVLTITILICLAFSSRGFAQEGEFKARVFPINGPPMLIDNFTMNDKTKLYAEWRGSYTTMLFQQISTIQYLEPGSPARGVEITFSSGRKDRFVLIPGIFHGKSDFGAWSMHPEKIVSIEINPSSASGLSEYGEYRNFDQVILKNGDMVTGQVLTKTFKIRTAYANLSLETQQIGFIDFDGKDAARDVVLLRVGDRLSGTLEQQSIKLLMRSGEELSLHKDKLKRIIFVLVKK